MQISWPKWFDENKRFCPSKSLVRWIKRATGIGYRKFPPLPTESVVNPRMAEPLRKKSDQIVREVERLEAELRRLGIRSYTQFWYR